MMEEVLRQGKVTPQQRLIRASGLGVAVRRRAKAGHQFG